MALSQAEKHDVVYFLGWSGLTIVTGSTQYNSVVVDRLKNLTPDIERLVRGLLSRLKGIDQRLESALCRVSTKAVDNIQINDNEIPMLRKERMKLVRELSDYLDIPVEKSGGSVKTVVC